MTVSCRQNVEAILGYLGVRGVEITRVEPDRCYGWDTERRLLAHCVVHGWLLDLLPVARQLHGDSVVASYRERKAPSLQVCIHKLEEPRDGMEYFVELDCDEQPANPQRPDKLLLHGLEVVTNSITGRKTDQKEIAVRLLLDRGICV